MSKKINSDTAALRTRAALNATGSAKDLEQWIFQIAQPGAGQHVLDLGCGTGKQVFAVAPLVQPRGSVLGVDISADAVTEVNRRAKTRKLSHVSAVKLSLDECVGALRGRTFDLVLSTYAIYYAKDLVGLLKDLKNLLSPGGSLFLCGYGKGTNREMISLVNGLAGRTKPAKPIGDWISARQLQQVARRYAKVKTHRLANSVRMNSAQALLNWWRNHASYVPALDGAVEKAVEAHFAKHGFFEMTKNVLGIHVHV